MTEYKFIHCLRREKERVDMTHCSCDEMPISRDLLPAEVGAVELSAIHEAL